MRYLILFAILIVIGMNYALFVLAGGAILYASLGPSLFIIFIIELLYTEYKRLIRLLNRPSREV